MDPRVLQEAGLPSFSFEATELKPRTALPGAARQERTPPARWGPVSPPMGDPPADLWGLAGFVRSGPPSVLSGVTPRLIDIHGDDDMTVSEDQRADTYMIGLPDSWDELPLAAEDFDARMRSLLEQLRSQGWSTVHRRQLELLHRQQRDVLLSSNCVFGATMVGFDASSHTSVDGELVMAGLTILAQDREELGAPGPLTPAMLRGGLVDRAQRAAAEGQQVAADVRPVTEVDLPAGRAVRMVRLHNLGPSQRVGDGYFSHATLLPHDDGERLCTVQFVSPNVSLSEPLCGLFDALVETLRILGPDDPTTFDQPPADVGAGDD